MEFLIWVLGVMLVVAEEDVSIDGEGLADVDVVPWENLSIVDELDVGMMEKIDADEGVLLFAILVVDNCQPVDKSLFFIGRVDILRTSGEEIFSLFGVGELVTTNPEENWFCIDFFVEFST